MRRTLAVTALTTILLSTAACGTDDNEPADETGAASPQHISTEEFCHEFGEEEIRPLTDNFVAAVETFTQTLPDLEPSDEDQIEALIDDIETEAQALAEAYRDAGAVLEDPDLASDAARAGETIGAFPQALRRAVLTGDLGDTDPSVAVEEAFGSLARHCE